ncbi:thrombopoietin receptor [Aulostomus maculatus]
MKFPYRWEILLNLWIQVVWVYCKEGTVTLSPGDIRLLKDEEDPKCFTRTEEDFTCFFETRDNGTYDFLYKVDRLAREKGCDMSAQRTEEGTFLHICSFPYLDVVLYVETHIRVVERSTNNSLYSRIVSVEDQFVLDPPFNVSLHQNGQVGQLQVSWHTKVSKYWEDKVHYKIRYSSNELGEKTKEVYEKWDNAVLTLVPGEEVKVQVTVKCANSVNAGHWSHWSNPVRAVTPQSAEDISLTCCTSDLQTITCHWNGSRYNLQNEYTLFYKMHLSDPLGWTGWTPCLTDRRLTDLCSFHADHARKVQVKLISTPAPLSRTFYTHEFMLIKNIKTSPPGHLIVAVEKDKLCLKWEAPLLSLSAHLQYEVGYQIRQHNAWLMLPLKGPVTSTCLEVPTGGQYSVKVRTKPDGSIYSGHWSDWSDAITGYIPMGLDPLLIMSIPATILITAIILIFLFSTYFRKLKKHFWPPVPNLDKVLQGFLTEINGQAWDPPHTAKQWCEETTSSVVEVMSKDGVSGLGIGPPEESTQLLEEGYHSGERLEGTPGTELKIFPDYVTLNRDSIIICPKGNKYVGEKRRVEVGGERQCSCTEGSDCVPTCFGADFLNHSYLPLAESAEKFGNKVTPGNLYSNFPRS